MRIVFVAALLAVFAGTGAQAAGEYQGRIERSFPARADGKIAVTTERGNIDLDTWSRDEVSVVITIAVSGVSDEDAKKIVERFAVDMRGEEGDVFVDVNYDRPLRPLRRQPNVRLVIQVPERYNADLTTAGGDITVLSLGGSAELRTSGGDVTARKVTADVRAITSGGDLLISGAGGSVEARTSGGDVDVVGAKDSVVAITSGGDVTIRYDVAELPTTEARTSGGDVTVSVLEGASARLDASTSSGSVECELPVTVVGKLARGRLSGTLGEGGNLVTLRSAGGSIRILKH